MTRSHLTSRFVQLLPVGALKKANPGRQFGWLSYSTNEHVTLSCWLVFDNASIVARFERHSKLVIMLQGRTNTVDMELFEQATIWCCSRV